MGRWCLAGLLLTVAVGASLGAAEPSKSALETGAEGWVDITPSAGLKGWSRVPVPPGDPRGKQQWHLDDSGEG
ncbi:MAG: hypothetical protein RBU21_07440, partial [FCB group bacterium]|nr:hypothetical protein [FCB group bacterium]